jgi:hypothetical protein
MNVNWKKSCALISSAILLFCAVSLAFPADEPLKRIDIPNGGHIIYGPMTGQLTSQAAMGQILHRVGVLTGDRPVIQRVVQSPDGQIAAVLFTVTAKNQDNKSMAGLALVSAPKTGNAEVALLTDYADRFSSTVMPMFQRLKQELGITASSNSSSQPNGSSSSSSSASPASSPKTSSASSSAPPKPTAPAQPLTPAHFPDGSGTIGLPSGWSIVRASKGDVFAKGQRGEVLRFGMPVSVLDPNDPRTRTLMPNPRGPAPSNFVLVPFGTDPGVTLKSVSAQLAQKIHKQPPVINIANVENVPTKGGGKSYFYFGDIDMNDGQGPVYFVEQLFFSQQMALGGWQITVYQINIPKPIFAEEIATIAQIFPSYGANDAVILSEIKSEMDLTKRITDNYLHWVDNLTDSTDRSTAGMSNLLRNQTVLRDTGTGSHGTTSDNVADLLMRTFPGEFESVPLSQYIKGIDY